MQLHCPECNATITISGGVTPKFCSNCGAAVSSFVQEQTNSGLGDVTQPPQLREESARHSSTKFEHATITRASEEPAADSDATSSQVGPYSLIRKLGQGGMGTVYEAVNEHTGQRVALKLLSRSLRTTEESVQRFRRESKIAASINHPRSTFVYEAGEQEGQFYIAMELMPGGTLKEIVEEKGALPVGQAVDYILDMIDGLQVAHEAGVVHRDIKPSNSFVDHDGRIKIGDFGLSKSFTTDSALTQTGTFMGTPQFAAPEQLRAAEVDERTDIYALGGTLFFLLTGRAPFKGGAAQVIASIASETPVRVNTIVKNIPRELARIISQTLEKDPAKRPENLAQLRSALLPFSKRGATLADVGRRMAAFFMDLSIAGFLGGMISQLVAFFAIATFTSSGSFQGVQLLVLSAQAIVAILYFAILEWRWGRTLGKWLLGMRVIGANAEPPPLANALLRAAMVPGMTWIISSLPSLYLDFGIQGNIMTLQDVIGLVTMGQLAAIAGWIPTLLCLVSARSSNGFRGLHEIASGTRVVRLSGTLESKRLEQIPITAPVKTGAPEKFGTVEAVARYSIPLDPNAVYLGKDPDLDRSVWIFVGEGNLGTFEGDRTSVNRPGRLKILGGDVNQASWQATDAIQGSPLVEIIAQRKSCSWPSVRSILQELAVELDDAIADQTLPEKLRINQVWVDQAGRMKLLDRELPVKEAQVEFAIHDDPDPVVRASSMFANLLEFYTQHHSVPMHVIDFQRQFAARMQDGSKPRQDNLKWANLQLADFADRPSHWEWDDRLGLLAVSFGSELPIYTATVFASGLLLIGILEQSPMQMGPALLCLGSAVAFLSGYLFDGGLAMRFSGIQVCRKGVRYAASKLRCGIRSVVVWLPFIAIFVSLVIVIQLEFMKQSQRTDGLNIHIGAGDSTSMQSVFLLLGLIPLGLLIAFGIIWALLRPSRAIPDLLVGTELIRK
jgi:uncharacterized RDD family membrane protein YckC